MQFERRYSRETITANLHENGNARKLFYFCKMSSKSILVILNYTISKLVRFLGHSVHLKRANAKINLH